MGNSARRDITALDKAEMQRKACVLRRKKYSYDAISKEMGLSGKGQAHKLVHSAIEEIPREAAEDVLMLELEGIDVLEAKAWERHSKGDPSATDQILRIKARRAKYLGLDAVVKTELTGKDGAAIVVSEIVTHTSPAEARRVIQELFGNVNPAADAVADPAGDGEPPKGTPGG